MKRNGNLLFLILVLSGLHTAVFQGISFAEDKPVAVTKNVSLRVDGDKTCGFYVTILAGNAAVNNQSRCGEFSVWFQNADASVKDAVENWKATEWKGDSSHIELTGKTTLTYVADLWITVTYDVINEHVVRKRIAFYQTDMPVIFLKTTNRIEPAITPEKYWSFDQADCKGGYLRDLFPAIGYRTSDGNERHR